MIGNVGDAYDVAFRDDQPEEPRPDRQRTDAGALLGADTGGVEPFDLAVRVEDAERLA